MLTKLTTESTMIDTINSTLIKAWEWREGMASVYDGYPEGTGPYKNRPRRDVMHARNIRAILFHPSGDYVFVGKK